MLDWNLLANIFIISLICSLIMVIFIQKTKRFCRNNSWIIFYSFIVNMIFGFLFSISFSNLEWGQCIWIGLFSFLGSDTIYQFLEDKLFSYTDSVSDDSNFTPSAKEEDIVGEIDYE